MCDRCRRWNDSFVESNARGERYLVGTETLFAAKRLREWISHRVVWEVFVSLSGKSRDFGRWGRDAGAKNGVVMHRLDHIVEDDSDDDDEEDSDDDSMDDDDEEDE